MKKILTLLVVIFAFTTLSFSQSAFTVQGGYSWLNGVVGAEYQMGHIAISAGYYPAKMPGSGDPIASFSGAVTWYDGLWSESGYYASIGFASAGYRHETSYNGGAWGSDIVSPMTIGMIGYKYGSYTGYNMKLGFGYGWCDQASTFTWELTIGYSFGM